ncbi:hypothetical protein SAMN02745133_02967 [Desulforamulus putei DSM 12395]|uniref:Helix-turn-helix n=1 Tax=Desulforamulus putei DSM 12395 TaxID=1121429 RepID=A0A1M5CM69_9FIRM|nr:hypothetical protein [Desulforamulus putei]SHF55800.1 hypothetical protein SAMN02745133_02967 [Desulforamulus putei DSM 12395]
MISYANILRHAIKASGKTLQEISEECRKRGISISNSYLSRLQNGFKNPPREQINNVLAQVLGVDSEILNAAGAAQKIKKAYPNLKIKHKKRRVIC